MPGDIIPLAGMLFSLLVVLIIGGLILLFPLSKRLGQLIELRLEERRAGDTLPAAELEELRRSVESLQAEVSRIAERQQFTERLLETGRTPRTPDGGT
jgi:hypothetical protein